MLNGWSSSSSRVVEILTIIMLTPTGQIGLGYGFGVEQLSWSQSLEVAEFELTPHNQPNSANPEQGQSVTNEN